jgi:hypothetical protein
MRRVGERANAAPEQKGHKVGVLRFASLDVKLVGVERLDVGAMEAMGLVSSMIHRYDIASTGGNLVSTTVQCAFQIPIGDS